MAKQEQLVWEFKLEDGTPVSIKAPDRETAIEALKLQLSQDKPFTWKGLGEESAAALGRGTASAIGLPGTIRDIMQSGLQQGMSKAYEGVTGDVPDPETQQGGVGGFFERMAAGPSKEVRKEMAAVPVIGRDPNGPGIASGEEARRLMSKLTHGYTDRPPENVPEEYARTIMEFLPSAAMFGGAGLSSLLMGGVVPAVGSETAGQLARKYSPERPSWMPDWAPSAETAARVAGAVLSPAVVQGARKVVTPNPATKTARTDAAKYFEKEKIPYSAGQKTGSVNQQYRETETGGAPYAQFVEKQQNAFNRAALKRIGIDAEEATPELMTGAWQRIGDTFKGLAARNNITPQSQLGTDLKSVVKKYQDKVSAPNRAPVVDDMIKEIANAAKSGKITGEQYQSMVTRLREAGTGANADLSIATSGIRTALDDAMERSIAANNPADLGAWRNARNNWRDLNAIEQTLATGARGAEGIISPVKLRQVTTQQGGYRASAQSGQGDSLADLAKHGQVLMRQLAPDSGTATRLMKRIGGSATAGAGVGGAIGTMVGGPGFGTMIGSGVGAVSGPILSALKSRAIMSAPVQKYLGNQVLKKPPPILGDVPQGGLMRILEQEQSASRAKKRGSAGGHNAD